MFDALPTNALDAKHWTWDDYQPYADNLTERELTADTVEAWLLDMTKLILLASEVSSRLYVAKTIDTTDEEAEAQYNHYLENIQPHMQKLSNALNQQLLESGLQPDGLEVAMRNIRAEVDIFCEENIPLQIELSQMGTQYDKISGAQTVEWEGEERTLAQMRPIYQDADRSRREAAFHLISERQLQDRDALNKLWREMFLLRQEVAANAGFDDFRAYQWKSMGRFDYTPDDALTFFEAIADTVVPVAKRLHEKRRQRLGVDTLRPWDLQVDTHGDDPLRPFMDVQTLKERTESIFQQVNPELGAYFRTMREENLLDLDNRKGKAPGGYCTGFMLAKRPFIFMNAVGLHDDVQTMLHECGHAFHVFEGAHLPYMYQGYVPMEFAEVASMAMELLAAPYLPQSQGGFYSDAEAARARIQHLEDSILFWAYMAVVAQFQHWAYTNGDAALDTDACDAKWTQLWHTYMQGVDYSDLDDWVATGWHRKLHIFQIPFYYIEYGLAQMGAVQVWANSLADQDAALKQYRKALSLGGTAKLPDLYATAGAKLAFDSDTLGEVVSLMERTINELEAV